VLPPDEVRRRVGQASLMLRARLARDYGGGDEVPLERLFRFVERLEPSAEAYTRARQRLAEPAPTAPSA
jgi:hypothetical protein